MSKEQKDLEKKANELGEELGEEDTADIAGGGVCVCVIGGGGKKDEVGRGYDEGCYCFGGGVSVDKSTSDLRCFCQVIGGGDDR
ncbi:MAG: hypothetical protein LBL87_00735 [Ruminococcus sp.]|jgi:hypothetical protein|nr:hypothetical protein [Ruminococcus sp.]